jgi:hypothetical protein
VMPRIWLDYLTAPVQSAAQFATLATACISTSQMTYTRDASETSL